MIEAQQTLPMRWQAITAPLAAFSAWWLGELRTLVPASVRRVLQPDHPVVMVDLSDGRAILYPSAARRADQGRALGTLPLADGYAATRAALQQRLAEHGGRPPCLAVALPNVLTRQVELPAAAASDLGQVLRHDMDRQTPFRAADVRFTYRVIRRQAGATKLTVALTVAPITVCEQARALAAELGLTLAYCGADRAPPWQDNLWSVPSSRSRTLAVRTLAIVTGLLALIAAWLPLERDRREAEAVGQQLASVKAQQASLLQERAQLAGLAAAAQMAAEQRPEALPILKDVTDALPLTAWLDRLAWRDGRVEIVGHGADTAEIVARLAAVPRIRKVEYLTPVTNAGDGREQFTLAFEVHPAVEPAERGQ